MSESRLSHNLNIRLPDEMWEFLENNRINKSKLIRDHIRHLMTFSREHMAREEEKIKDDIAQLEKRMIELREKEDEKREHFEDVHQDYHKYGRGNLPDKANLEWLHNRYIPKFHSRGIFVTANELLDYCQGHPQ